MAADCASASFLQPSGGSSWRWLIRCMPMRATDCTCGAHGYWRRLVWCAAAAAWYRALTAVLSTTQLSNEAAASVGLDVRAALVYMVVALAFHATLVSLVVGRLLAELRHKARHDSLTGLLNRRAIEEAIGAQMQRGRRTGETHSLLMLDLDHFKSINDRLRPFGRRSGAPACGNDPASERAQDRPSRAGWWGGVPGSHARRIVGHSTTRCRAPARTTCG